MLVSDRVTLAREARKMSKNELAKRCKVTPSAITQIENGQTKSPTAKVMLAISKALSVDMEWLITGKGIPDFLQHALEPPSDYQAGSNPVSKLSDFQEVISAMEISIFGNNPPELLHAIFQASLDQFLRTPAGRACFANYLVHAIATQIGTDENDAELRQVVEKSIDETLQARVNTHH